MIEWISYYLLDQWRGEKRRRGSFLSTMSEFLSLVMCDEMESEVEDAEDSFPVI